MEQHLLNKIVSQFNIRGTVSDFKPMEKGLINDSYRVYTSEEDTPDYVLQHINNNIFEDVDMLMDNIITVVNHIRRKYEDMGMTDIDRHVLTFIPLKDNGKYYYRDDNGKYWRMMVFIPSKSKSEVTPETSYEVGKSFGDFQAMLADIDTELGESIPNFHNMEFRIKQLKDAVQEDKVHRLSKVQDLVNDILKDAEEMCLGERLYREGKLPKRICHCDTKVNNLLFDEDGNVLCVIDLDTVMPNFIFSDVGDFLRTAANTTNEDDADMNKVSFNMSIFKAFIKGYMETAGSFLLPVEIENIPYAAQLFPYMQAVRFLTDYLNGDTYYKITYPELNLDRTRNQFKLYKSVTEQKDQMAAFIRECLANKS